MKAVIYDTVSASSMEDLLRSVDEKRCEGWHASGPPRMDANSGVFYQGISKET